MKAKSLTGVSLFQPNRAQITFDPRGVRYPTVITLLQNADLSSFLHETGHFFLEVLTDIATQPDAPQQSIDDLNTVLDWFGITGDEKTSGTGGGELAQLGYSRVKRPTPAIRRFINNLTPSEQMKVTDSVAEKIIDRLKVIPSANEMAAIAHAGRDVAADQRREQPAQRAQRLEELDGGGAPDGSAGHHRHHGR